MVYGCFGVKRQSCVVATSLVACKLKKLTIWPLKKKKKLALFDVI